MSALHINGQAVTLDAVDKKPCELAFQLGGKPYRFRLEPLAEGGFALQEETSPGIWQSYRGTMWADGKGARRIQLAGQNAVVSATPVSTSAAGGHGALSPVAPMPGLVRQLLVKLGDTVVKGQALAVMEAMKLQITLAAGGDATVDAVLVKEGEMIAEGVELFKLTEKK
jgi:3-methylcrotonyl-CoA carboxylase alpha subunit